MSCIDKETVREALSVPEYAKEIGVDLHGRGKWRRGTCPLCGAGSSRPFCASVDAWTCHACGEKGDLFTLCERVERIAFPDNLPHLARLAGLDPDVEVDAQAREQLAHRKHGRKTIGAAEKLADEARRQVAQAGAPGIWQNLATSSTVGESYMRRRGVGAVMREVRFSEIGVCLPLRALDGTIINVFERRIDGSEPKIQGLTGCTTLGMFGDFSKFDATEGPIVVVEGMFDWLSARVLAPNQLILGAQSSSRLPEVVRQVARRCKERGILFAADKDDAGTRAVRQAIAIAVKHGVPEAQMQVIDVGPGNNDLADLLQSGGDLAGAPTISAATFSIDWPEPELMPQEQRPVPQLDESLLPPALRPWLVDIAERAQCPLEYPAAAAIVALASAIGRRLAIRPKQRDDWTVVPNLWGAIVGHPGVMKSAPVQEALKPLLRIQRRAREDFEREKAEFKKRQAAAQDQARELQKKIKEFVQKGLDPKKLRQDLDALNETPPKLPRYVVYDTTTEKLGELLAKNPRGMLLYRDELRGWFKALSKTGREGDRSFYLESWNGDGSSIYDRIGRGSVFIEAACVSIIGTIQPGPLQEILQGAVANGTSADGLMQRFQVIVYPDTPSTWQLVDRWPDTEAKTRAYEVFETLIALERSAPISEQTDRGIPYVRFAEDAQTYFHSWLGALERQLRRRDGQHPALIAHAAKYRSLMPSLALQFHLVEWAAQGGDLGPVSLEAAVRAAKWCEFLDGHVMRIYGVGDQSVPVEVRLLAQRIRAGQLTGGFTVRELLRRRWAGLSDRDTLTAAVTTLETMQWLVRRRAPGRGRPREEYLINPRLASI